MRDRVEVWTYTKCNNGTFFVDSLLGSGGGGRVFKVLAEDGREYALKELHGDLNRIHPHLVTHFLVQHTELDDEPIVDVIAVDIERARILLSIVKPFEINDKEIHNGRELQRELKKQPLPHRLLCVLQLFVQHVEGFRERAERGVHIFDIKLRNLVPTLGRQIEFQGDVYDVPLEYTIVDLDYYYTNSTVHTYCADGYAQGTPGYISPECWQGRSITYRANLFALGVCMYELLMGQSFWYKMKAYMVSSKCSNETEYKAYVSKRLDDAWDVIQDEVDVETSELYGLVIETIECLLSYDPDEREEAFELFRDIREVWGGEVVIVDSA